MFDDWLLFHILNFVLQHSSIKQGNTVISVLTYLYRISDQLSAIVKIIASFHHLQKRVDNASFARNIVKYALF